MIEELISRAFFTRDAAHLAHWRTKSYAEHQALGAFYDELVDLLDGLVETYQGAFGIVKPLEIKGGKAPADIAAHLGSEAKWIEKNRDGISKDFDSLGNLIDGLSGLYLKTYYMLKNFS